MSLKMNVTTGFPRNISSHHLQASNLIQEEKEDEEFE